MVVNQQIDRAKGIRDIIATRRPCLGAAIGSGLSARAAEDGGVDFLMILTAGYFRTHGCSSMAALMPYSEANALAIDIASHHVLPRIRKVPVLLGLSAQDASLESRAMWNSLHQLGVAGVTNFPSVGFIDGQYREALEEADLGYSREVELLVRARKEGLVTVAFVFNEEEAVTMAEVGVDILCIDLGFAEWRELTEDQHAHAMDVSIGRVAQIRAAVRVAGRDVYSVVFGGPVLTPRDVTSLLTHTDVQGYIGGSSIERFPAASHITQTVREFKSVISPIRRPAWQGAMFGQGNAMQEVFAMLKHVAATDAPVLLLGESGTGKELAARELHRLSSRQGNPMVSWNCGAVAESLAMSELFGHEKGAFTGASARHIGRFEQAHRGTLFMDEVGDLPPAVQASLLRVIQEREIVRVGGRQNIPVDVRLTAATNRDLPQLVRSGQFRLDLYYRLNTVVIRIPPLRERPDDIPVLVNDFFHEFCQRHGFPVPHISGSTMDLFLGHWWPGNIRELRNAVERCVILGRGESIRVEWLRDLFEMATVLRHDADKVDSDRGSDSASITMPLQRRSQARGRLEESLQRHNGNLSAVARELGVTRKTIYSWISRGKSQYDQ